MADKKTRLENASREALFFDENAPIFRERFRFEAQYGFDRPRAWAASGASFRA